MPAFKTPFLRHAIRFAMSALLAIAIGLVTGCQNQAPPSSEQIQAALSEKLQQDSFLLFSSANLTLLGLERRMFGGYIASVRYDRVAMMSSSEMSIAASKLAVVNTISTDLAMNLTNFQALMDNKGFFNAGDTIEYGVTRNAELSLVEGEWFVSKVFVP